MAVLCYQASLTWFACSFLLPGLSTISTQFIVSEALTATSDAWVTHGSDANISCSDLPSFTFLQLSQSSPAVTDVDEAREILRYHSNTGIDFVQFSNSSDSSHYTFQESGGSYLLTVKSVTVDDSGKYWCRTVKVPPPQGGTGRTVASSVTHIRVPPNLITITYGGTSYSNAANIPIVVGDNRQIVCTSPAVNPAARFTWTLPTGITTDQPQGTQTNTSNSEDNRLVDSSNMINANIAKRPATSQLVCSATNRQDGLISSEANITVTVQIRVPPEVVKLSDDDGEKTPGGTVAVDQGSSHTFTCLVPGTRPAATIQWFFGGTMPSTGIGTPTSSETNELFDTRGTWSFLPLRAHHKQIVKCESNTSESQLPYVSIMVTLDVIGPPDIPVISGSPSMTENIENALSCTADLGYPSDWSLVWSNGRSPINGSSTSSSASGSRYSFTSMLNFTPSRQDNGNNITCTASRSSWTLGPFGSLGPIDVQFCTTSVSVTSCPFDLNENDTLSLTCASESSNPASTLIWLKNDEEQSSSNQPNTPGSHGGRVTRVTYTIDAVNRNNNRDVLRCCSDTTTCTTSLCDVCILNVKYTPKFTSLSQLPDNPVIEGSNVTLTCTIDANPSPADVTWGKRDSNDALRSKYSNDTSTLILNNIKREEAGYYTCKTNNGVPSDAIENNVISDPLTVIVYYEANVTNKAMIEVGVKDGDDAVLICIAVGNPKPVMTWFGPNNTMITSDTDKRFMVSNKTTGGVLGYEVTSNLTIVRVDSQVDYGVYICSSSNKLGGEDLLKINLTGTRRPNKPSQIRITQQTSESLTVTWTAGYDGGEEQSFRVTYLKTSNSTETSTYENVTGGKTTYNVTGLEDYTEYEIKVYAKNAIGESDDSAKVVGYTLPKSPSPKEGITVEYNTDDGTVKVTGLRIENSCIQLEVKYKGNDTWQECGKCIDSDQRVTLSEWCAVSQTRRRRAIGGIEDVRAKLCIGGLCSEAAPAKQVKSPSRLPPTPPSDTRIIVGAVVGGVVLLAIIIALATYLVRMSPKDQRSRRKKTTDSFSNGSDIELQSPSNVAGPEEGNGIANEGVQNHEYDELSRKERHPVYPNPAVRGDSLPPETGAYEEMKVAASKTCSENATNKVQENVEKSSPEETVNETTNKVTNRDSKPPITRPKPKSIKKYQPPSRSADEIPKRKAELAGATETTETTDTYAQVNKNLPPKPKGINPPQNLPDVTYASVNKDQKLSLSPLPEDYGAKKKPKKYVPPSARAAEESAYEEVRINDNDKGKNPSAEGDGNTYDGVGAQQDTGGRTANDDGLIYVEVGHARVHPPDQPPIQTEPSTEYASLDFSRMSKKED